MRMLKWKERRRLAVSQTWLVIGRVIKGALDLTKRRRWAREITKWWKWRCIVGGWTWNSAIVGWLGIVGRKFGAACGNGSREGKIFVGEKDFPGNFAMDYHFRNLSFRKIVWMKSWNGTYLFLGDDDKNDRTLLGIIIIILRLTILNSQFNKSLWKLWKIQLTKTRASR